MACTAVFPHILLQDATAPTASSYRAVFKVGHGCEGEPTTRIAVAIPEGFSGAQPMPKPGWTLSTRMGKLAQPVESHGKTLTEGVQEIIWTANGPDNYLPSAFYDEFVLRGTTPKTPGALWFKVTQTCTAGVNAWVELPAQGLSTRGLKSPAAVLEVLAAPGTPTIPGTPDKPTTPANGHVH